MRHLKLGVHLQGVSEPALAWARVAPIVKAIDSVRPFQAAQDGALRVFRHYFPTQSLDRNPNAAAAEIIQALHGYNHQALFVELFNECYQDGAELDRYIEWTRQATIFLHGAGYLVAGFSFSTGNPTEYPGAWERLRAARYAGVDALSLHQYWNGRTGTFTEWNALRHRLVHQWTEGDHPPILITECGADAVEGGPSGWKLCGITAQQYAAQLKAYDWAISQDDYVLGATVFGGAPGPDWVNFSTDELDVEPFRGLPPRVIWLPEGGATMLSDNYVIDPETRAEIARLGWTPAGSYDSTPESYGVTVCREGLIYYLNGPGIYRNIPFG